MGDFVGSGIYDFALIALAIVVVGFIAYRNALTDGWLRTCVHAIASIVMAVTAGSILIAVAVYSGVEIPTSGPLAVLVNMAILAFVLRIAGPYTALWCSELTDRLEARVRAHSQRRRERALHARWARQVADTASNARLADESAKALPERERPA